ncbi:MAG: Gfo/Idh/MocA family oxidoreductase [Proteobacteria bacterium]|nr:Gfo/Idh/MocA family oxidoreductase [Pseudomonadota bacterium]
MTMRTVRWGMIGCGEVAEVKSGPAFYKARDSTLVAVMRRSGALAADFARRHGVARWHDDADEIIEASDIDAVYIATRPDTHANYTLRCAAAGKAVYVEKPMALRVDECEAMVSACEAARIPLWVAFYRRRLPRFVAVKARLEAGAIGIPLAVSIRHFVGSETSGGVHAWRRDAGQGGGEFIEGACHTWDLVDWLVGPVADVAACVENRAGISPTEEVVATAFRTASGVAGTALWAFVAGAGDEQFEIVGTEGTLRFSVTRPTPIEIARRNGVEHIAIADPEHVQQPLVQAIVDEINGTDACPSTGVTALRTARVMETVMQVFRRPPSSTFA